MCSPQPDAPVARCPASKKVAGLHKNWAKTVAAKEPLKVTSMMREKPINFFDVTQAFPVLTAKNLITAE